MRGKRFGCVKQHLRERNIPAYAGKTRQPGLGRCLLPEHPRVCGENRYCSMIDTVASGTSPRMRGKPKDCAWCPFNERNIPAYAGKTIISPPESVQQPEHPRVCGENRVRGPGVLPKYGTSPRMRGKQKPCSPGYNQRRNIPAYAGKRTLVDFLEFDLRNIPAYAGKTNSSSSC